jgi:hypothetical protein
MITKKLDRLIDFIESESAFPRILVLDMLLVFACMYDIHALLRYFKQAQDHYESDETILETIMHDLNGITQNPETFRPRTAGYSDDTAKTSEEITQL